MLMDLIIEMINKEIEALMKEGVRILLLGDASKLPDKVRVKMNEAVRKTADNTKISVHGEGMKNIPGVAAKLFTLMAGSGIEIKLVTTSEVDISYLIYDKDVDRAILAIKQEYSIE